MNGLTRSGGNLLPVPARPDAEMDCRMRLALETVLGRASEGDLDAIELLDRVKTENRNAMLMANMDDDEFTPEDFTY